MDWRRELSTRLGLSLTTCILVQATEQSKGHGVYIHARSFTCWRRSSTWLNSQRNILDRVSKRIFSAKIFSDLIISERSTHFFKKINV